MIESVTVVGLGYIGLPTAAALATQRINVLGVDVDPHAVATINQGRIHIVEPELDVAVQAAAERQVHEAQRVDPFRRAPEDAMAAAHVVDESFARAVRM